MRTCRRLGHWRRSARALIGALACALFTGFPSHLRAQTTKFTWEARFQDHEVPSSVTLVDADGDGRAELVRVRVPVNQPKGADWWLPWVRLGTHPERVDDSTVMGGSVGALALDARIRAPRIAGTISTKDSSEVTLEFEFDAEEVRGKLRGHPGTLVFEMHRVLGVETASPDADRYRSVLQPIPVARLGWLPGRILGAGAAIRDGRVEFSARVDADRDGDCPIRATVMGLSRPGWKDSLVVLPVKAGVTPASFSMALPAGLPSDLDSVNLQLHVTDIRGPLFEGKFWHRDGKRPGRGAR